RDRDLVTGDAHVAIVAPASARTGAPVTLLLPGGGLSARDSSRCARLSDEPSDATSVAARDPRRTPAPRARAREGSRRRVNRYGSLRRVRGSARVKRAPG